jgi:hypothetical protein
MQLARAVPDAVRPIANGPTMIRAQPLPPRNRVDRRRLRPLVDRLEQRTLLYSETGGQWTFGSRITYSFAPDGTSIGGVPSTWDQTRHPRGPLKSFAHRHAPHQSGPGLD